MILTPSRPVLGIGKAKVVRPGFSGLAAIIADLKAWPHGLISKSRTPSVLNLKTFGPHVDPVGLY